MYWLDTAILAVVAVGAIFGALSGLLMQLARIVGFALALYAAIGLNDPASSLCRQFMGDAEPWVSRAVAYVGVFLIVYLVIFIATLIIERGLRGVRLQALNRVFGAVLGAAKVGLLVGAVLLGLSHFPSDTTRQIVERSALGPPLAKSVEVLLSAVVGQYGEELRGGLEGAARNVPSAAKILEQLNKDRDPDEDD